MRALSPRAAVAVAWLAALVVVIVVAAAAGWTVTAHGYFAGWLVAASLPLGALPVLMVLDLLGGRETPVRTTLRLLLASLPVLALLLVPVLLDLKAVFPWATGTTLAPASAEPLKGFARTWYTPGFFGLRSAAYLLLWVALSLFFVRPAPPSARHRRVAGIGLPIHLVLGTLAAFDWWMSLDHAFLSSVYGLLVIATQMAFAMTAASLLAMPVPRRSEAVETPFLLALLAVLFTAAFLQFSQYLVVWSANLPKEIVWYQARWVGVLGPIFVIGAPVILVLGTAVLIPSALAAMRVPVLAALGGFALLAVLDLACLASPRGTFTIPGVLLDLAFLFLIGGIGAGCAMVLAGRRSGALHHG